MSLPGLDLFIKNVPQLVLDFVVEDFQTLIGWSPREIQRPIRDWDCQFWSPVCCLFFSLLNLTRDLGVIFHATLFCFPETFCSF